MGQRTAVDDPDSRAAVGLRAGDHAAFNLIYLRHARAVHQYLTVLLRDPDVAEDVAQEAFLRAFKYGGQYQARGERFEAWLFRIVRNCALDHIAAHRRVRSEDPFDLDLRREQDSPAQQPALLRWDELASQIERLPPGQQQVLGLRYLCGLPTTDIAQVLERSTDAIRQLEARALRLLRLRISSAALASGQ